MDADRRRFFSRLRAAVVFLVALAMAAGCAGCRKPISSDPSAPVRIGYFANLTHAQAVLGVSSGDFANALAPAPLDTKVFNAGPSLIEALFAGEIDIGYVGPGPALSAYNRSRGDGIRVIAGAASNGVIIVARKESAIHTMADLAGKKVATPQLGNTQDISARHFFQATLGDADARGVTPIDNAQQSQMLSRGDVDAAWVPEPWGQRLIAETGARIVAEEKELWPTKDFSLTLIVTTPEFLAKRPDAVAKVLAVSRAWTEKLTREPEAQVAPLVDALAKLTGKRLSPQILGPALSRVRFTDEPSEATLQTFSTWTQELGFGRGGDLGKLVDTKVLRSLPQAEARH